MAQRPARPWLGTLGALAFIFLWASAFVPSRIVSTSAPPFWILAIRCTIAGAILFVGARIAGVAAPWTRRQWLDLTLLGLTQNTVYLGFTYLALKHLSSGMGAIIASTNPLILALVAPYLLREPLTLRKIVGMVLGFSGVLIAMITRAGTQSARPVDVLLALIAVLGSVASTILYKQMTNRPHPIMVNGVQLFAAGLSCALIAIFLHGPPQIIFSQRVVLALVWLIVVMSILASLLWFWLLQHGDASRVSAWYFLTPVFGLMDGAVLLGEKLKPMDGVGLLVIAVGLLLVTRDPAAAKPR